MASKWHWGQMPSGVMVRGLPRFFGNGATTSGPPEPDALEAPEPAGGVAAGACALARFFFLSAQGPPDPDAEDFAGGVTIDDDCAPEPEAVDAEIGVAIVEIGPPEPEAVDVDGGGAIDVGLATDVDAATEQDPDDIAGGVTIDDDCPPEPEAVDEEIGVAIVEIGFVPLRLSLSEPLSSESEEDDRNARWARLLASSSRCFRMLTLVSNTIRCPARDPSSCCFETRSCSRRSISASRRAIEEKREERMVNSLWFVCPHLRRRGRCGPC